MADDVLLDKAAIIERCVARAREEYAADPASFERDVTRQDAAVLNVQRACEAALDMGHYLIRRERLGLPQGARDVFTLLARGGWVEQDVEDSLRRMVGFRNIAVHEYQKLLLPIVVAVITEDLDDLLSFARGVLLRDAQRSGR